MFYVEYGAQSWRIERILKYTFKKRKSTAKNKPISSDFLFFGSLSKKTGFFCVFEGIWYCIPALNNIRVSP